MADKRKLMKGLIFVGCTVLLLLFTTKNVLSTTYYISSTLGDDTWEGTEPEPTPPEYPTNGPWKTLETVEIMSHEDAFAPGDTILLRRGDIWNEAFVFQSRGTEDNPLTLSSYGAGALPIINGQQSSTPVTIYNAAFITLEDLEITGGITGINIIGTEKIGTENLTLNNLVVHDNTISVAWSYGAIVVNEHSTNINILNSSVYNNYNCSAGIYLLSANTTVKGCHVYNNNHGIFCRTNCTVNAAFHITENYVHDNEKFGISVEHKETNGGCTSPEGSTIEKNTCEYNSRELSNSYYSWHNIMVRGAPHIVRYNYAGYAFRGGDGDPESRLPRHDGGGIEIKASGVECYNNIIYHNDGPGIQLYNEVNEASLNAIPLRDIKVYNNLLYKNARNPGTWKDIGNLHSLSMVSNSEIKNNIIVGSKAKYLTQVVNTTGMLVDYNLYFPDGESDQFKVGGQSNSLAFDLWQQVTGFDQHALVKEPCFRDPEAGDFHLRSQSACIDAGDPTFDYSYELEPNGCRINLGPHGNTSEAISSTDADEDELYGFCDNCPDNYNPGQTDSDEDGIGDTCDNCPEVHNSGQDDDDLDGIGNICDYDKDNDGVCDPGGFDPSCSGVDNCPSVYNPNQEDTFPPQGNEIGDACECEADIDGDNDVDADDIKVFLKDFGRSPYYIPCEPGNTCSGDFDCDGNVDSDDVDMLLEDFGRERYFHPCPTSEVENGCVYE